MKLRDRLRKRFLIALLAPLALAFVLTSPALAHGGEGDQVHGPAALWMVGLIYIQLVMILIVGVWLTQEAVAAWRPRRHAQEMEGV